MHQLTWRKNSAFDEAKVGHGIFEVSTNNPVMASGIPAQNPLRNEYSNQKKDVQLNYLLYLLTKGYSEVTSTY